MNASVAASAMLLTILAAALPSQGSVLQVGATRPFATIQAAVQAAADGDVVEVDPGTYPSFAIAGKQVSVIANQSGGTGASFLVAGSIVVTGLQPGQDVTIANARATATATAPAISIQGGPGRVRLLNVQVVSGNLGVVGYGGLIEVRNTSYAWFDRVRAGDYRFRANGAQGATGLAALLVDSTSVHLTRCVLHGNRSDSSLVSSGAAMDIYGQGTTWAVDSTFVGGLAPIGAQPGVSCGHAVHDRGGVSGLIRACDCTLMTTTPGVPAFAVVGVGAYLMACLPDTIARTELTTSSTEVAIGTTATMTVSANVPNRLFVTLLATEFGGFPLPVLLGDLLASGSFGILTGGVLAGPTTLSLTIPLQPALVGLQCTAQSMLVESPVWFVASTGAAFTLR